MSDSEKKATLTLSKDKKEPLRLGLKAGGDSASARPSGGGRGRSVQVEVRRKRVIARDTQPEAADVSEQTHEPVAVPTTTPAPEPKVVTTLPDAAIRNLSTAEKAARARALAEAEEVEAARIVTEEQEAKRRAEEEQILKVQAAEEAEKQAEEDKRRTEENAVNGDEATAAAANEPAPIEEIPVPQPEPVKPAPIRETTRNIDVEESSDRGARNRAAGRGRGEDQRRRGRRLTVTQALSDDEERTRSLASVRRQRARNKQARTAEPPVKVVREVVIPETITVADLANRMAERGVDVIKILMGMGVMANASQVIDADTAEIVVTEMGHKPQRVSEADVEIGLGGAEDRDEEMQPRTPVVTVMGHVDHGKTSLLDALRESDVAGGEAGGITQHIGAYQILSNAGNRITFIDTPGHAAFTAMRQRGASVTDIVILVVAADDGVMPQTIEAINHAKAAEVPIIVAINKIDLPDSNPDRVKQELLQHEVISEDFGGDVQMVPVSALQKTNLDGLEEAVMLQAELLELTANPDRNAEGIVVEAELDKGRGPVATVLVQKGSLNKGDIFVAGAEYGRVRSLIDSYGAVIEAAGPSIPVEVLGLNGTPKAGDMFTVVETEAQAREVSEYRQRVDQQKRAVAIAGTTSLEAMFEKIKEGEVEELPIVVKADVQGSMEAILGAADNLRNDEVAVRVLHSGVGGITESDVTLAAASEGVVIGFNVRANVQARELARREGTDIRYYSIIYELVDDLRAVLSGMLAPHISETIVGNAEILEVFSVSKVGRIAGCRVTEGMAKRDAFIRVLRDDVVIHEGQMASLKRFKDDAREVREGNECGIGIDNYQDLRAGDVFEIFEKEEIERTL